MKSKRLMIIGIGYWGTKLYERFVKLVGVENIIVCDLNMDRWPKGPTSTQAYQVCINTVDACVVATEPSSHYKIALDCLLAGKDVLIEKPMALSVKEADILCTIAKAQGVTLMVDDTWRYRDGVENLLINGASASQFLWANPREKLTPEGILWTQGPHPLSLMLSMHGFPADVTGSLFSKSANLYYKFPQSRSHVIMSWESDIRVRQFVALNQRRCTVFSDDMTPQSNDAILSMCNSFLTRCDRQKFIDYHSLEVVKCLEWTQQKLS